MVIVSANEPSVKVTTYLPFKSGVKTTTSEVESKTSLAPKTAVEPKGLVTVQV